MNINILQPEVQHFIKENLKTEITKVILKGSSFKNVSIQEIANQILAKQKSEKKLSTWFHTENIYYPAKLSIEQTSSEITANYKSKIVSSDSIIDITGGFGVDAFYFSKQFKNVTHCEINQELSEIVKHNFQQLKVNNVDFFSGNGTNFLKETNKKFSCIYIDPSRRDDLKGKVFLLKDCQPYISPKIDFFFTKTDYILIKVSPILDLTQTINELKNVKEIHIVSINNEVKELLFLLEKNYNNSIAIKTVNFKKEKVQTFNFIFDEDVTSEYSEPLSYLYEPNSAILKSGGFHQITNKLNVFKLQQHSHLYTSEKQVNFPGRTFKIEHVLPYDKKKIIKLLPDKKANITTRNFPKTVAQIRKETKIKDGGNIFIFFSTNKSEKLIVIICLKI
ncbi:class I SAM-dependent methyltransferase [Polaribacter aestuariivivens]|uniref:Class I SAM-dependent methyltransferase n=1 Tax=Polaribacter aestuariivivens TaxID=2304626 RepID=A0A5S3N9J4_9FLAO|nr:class I SAM-dependent methyltransferase [Polaribacter aestuariivivens]TMM31930.1 class I SAM-dependent methyltransferase [Polaribacter aestuariivivens]